MTVSGAVCAADMRIGTADGAGGDSRVATSRCPINAGSRPTCSDPPIPGMRPVPSTNSRGDAIPSINSALEHLRTDARLTRTPPFLSRGPATPPRASTCVASWQ